MRTPLAKEGAVFPTDQQRSYLFTGYRYATLGLILMVPLVLVFMLAGWPTLSAVSLAVAVLFAVLLTTSILRIGARVRQLPRKTAKVRKMLLGLSFLGIVVWLFDVDLQRLKIFNVEARPGDVPISVVLALLIGFHLAAFCIYLWRGYFNKVSSDDSAMASGPRRSGLDTLSWLLECFIDIYLPPLLGIVAYGCLIFDSSLGTGPAEGSRVSPVSEGVASLQKTGPIEVRVVTNYERPSEPAWDTELRESVAAQLIEGGVQTTSQISGQQSPSPVLSVSIDVAETDGNRAVCSCRSACDQQAMLPNGVSVRCTIWEHQISGIVDKPRLRSWVKGAVLKSAELFVAEYLHENERSRGR